MNKSDGKSDLVLSSKIIMLSQWCTCGVIMNLRILLPVFNVSLSQNEIWSTGILYHPAKFSLELRSLQISLAFGYLRYSIPLHSSLSKWRKDTYANFSIGITSFIFCSIFSYIPTGPV